MDIRKRLAGLIAGVLTVASLDVLATPITSGAIVSVAPPVSVVAGAVESDTQILLFQERASYILPSMLDAEVTSPTTVTGSGGTTPGTIGAGIMVDAYFLHMDSATANVPIVLEGSITFDTDILAVILYGTTLDASDSIVGAVGTTYPVAGDFFRGTAEVGVGEDQVTLSANRRTLRVRARTREEQGFSGIDQLRILTVPSVPEPTTLLLLGLGLAGLGFARKRLH